MFQKLKEINQNRKLAIAIGLVNFVLMFIIVIISFIVIVDQQNRIDELEQRLSDQNETILLQGKLDNFEYEE